MECCDDIMTAIDSDGNGEITRSVWVMIELHISSGYGSMINQTLKLEFFCIMFMILILNGNSEQLGTC